MPFLAYLGERSLHNGNSKLITELTVCFPISSSNLLPSAPSPPLFHIETGINNFSKILTDACCTFGVWEVAAGNSNIVDSELPGIDVVSSKGWAATTASTAMIKKVLDLLFS